MNACLVLAVAGLASFQPEVPEARWKQLHEEMVTAIRKGHYDQAAFSGRTALQVAERLDREGPRKAETMIEVARVHWRQGGYGEADHELREVRKLLEKRAGKYPELEARAWNLHAEVLADVGQDEEAAALAAKAYKARMKKFGAEHLETVESVDTLAALGRAYDDLRGENFIGRSHWSVEEMSLKVREKLLGKEHPNLVASHIAVARNRLRDADAEKHLRLALKLLQKVNPRHPEIAETWTLLGRHLRLRAELHDADQVLKRALKPWRYHDDSGWPPRAARALLEVALLRGQQHKTAEADKLYQEALERHYFWSRDELLCDYLAKVPFHRRGFGSDEMTLTSPEALLHEMMRRGGLVIEKALVKRSQDLAKKLKPAKSDIEPHRNLEVLTALRRLQKLSDPVKIEVRGPARIEAIFPHIPDLDVALVNRDEKRVPVGYQAGGDYRTGRLERWRLQVRDAKGIDVPVVSYLSEFGGGLTGYAILKPDQKWEAALRVRSYVYLLPGDYTLEVQYHDLDSIAGLDWIGGRIVCKSDEIRLHVQPRVIDTSAAEQKTIADLIESLNGKDELRLLDGPYGKDHHKLIAPESPQGKLLSLGWKAVPKMIDEVTDEATSPRRRAWLLTILFTTTTCHNPHDEDGVLPDYRGPGFSRSGAKIDHEAQLRFARRWEAFRDYIVVRTGK
jgi:tetratricopeptide (TPR) repeat protein